MHPTRRFGPGTPNVSRLLDAKQRILWGKDLVTWQITLRGRCVLSRVHEGQNLTMDTRFVIVALTVAFSWMVTLSSPSRVTAEEPVTEFLEALEENRFYEVAINYVDRMATSKLAPAKFREEADLRRGLLYEDFAKATRNAGQKQQRLDAAEKALSKFLDANPNHLRSGSARSHLGNIIVERARGLVKQSKQPGANSEELLRQASGIYDSAYTALSTSRQQIGEQIKALMRDRDAETRAQLSATQEEYVSTYLDGGRVLFEQAETLKGNDKKYEGKLRDAIKTFEEVAQKYRKLGAGIVAILYEGECYQLLGEHKQALTYFKELLQNDDDSKPVRLLKTKALALSIPSWLATDEKLGPDRSISTAEAWLQGKGASLDGHVEIQRLRLALAKAHASKSKIEPKKALAERAVNEAKKLANDVARKPGPVQREAEELLVSLGGSAASSVEPASSEDTANLADFTAAYDAAKLALNEMKRADVSVKILSGQLDRVSDPERRAEMKERLDIATTQKTTSSAKALELFQRAAELATDENIDDLHVVRYYLSHLHYAAGDLLDAAVIAGFVANYYPGSVAGRECATVALASRQRLYQGSADQASELHAREIAKLAELMIARWPGEPQAETALLTLLNISVQQGNVEKAEEFLKRIPADSTKRARAELRIGQAFWSEYLKRISVSGRGEGAGDIDVEQMKTRAQEILATGIGRMKDRPVDEATIRAALSLAQIYVDSGKPDEALEMLDRPGLGAMALVEVESPWLERISGLATEAHKTAIRAQVASAANSGSAATRIRDAQKMLEDLREDLEPQPDGKKKMMSIYVGLARDLERQLKIADPASRKALSGGFESFLRGAAEGSQDIGVLNWVGETFYSLGNGMLQGTKTTPEAQRYFTEASKAFGDVLSLARKTPSALSESAMTQVRARQAMTLRQIGNYQEAVDLFADVLASRNRVLNIQVEAAKTLQQWGDSGDANAYGKAIVGDRPGKAGRNVIWGWGRIANTCSKNKQFRDSFHEARYNLALCRYKLALTNSGAKQKDLLGRAKADILLTKRLVSLGNKQQTQRYESLFKEIQKSLGEQPTGLEGTS